MSKIVGYSCGPSNEFAWLWTEETGVQCINGTVAEPFKTSMRALSNDGRVIGGDVNVVRLSQQEIGRLGGIVRRKAH